MPTIPIKDAAGVVGMRASCRLARKILEELVLRLEPGLTTGQVDEWAGQIINQYGARTWAMPEKSPWRASAGPSA
jgi:methionine aminopeptidase